MASSDSNPLLEYLESIPPHEATEWYFNAAIEIAIDYFGVESEEHLAKAVALIAVEDAWDVAMSYPHNVALLRDKLDSGEAGEEEFADFLFSCVMTALVLCNEARFLSEGNYKNAAWHMVNKSVQLLSLVLAHIGLSRAKSNDAKMKAKIRHKENHQMRDDVIRHYMENKDKYKSKDKAAEAMAGTLVPLGFRAVRKHLTGLE